MSAAAYKSMTVPTDAGVVVDLSEHANKLLDYEDIASDLTDEQENRIVDYVRSALQLSYDRISKRYDHWLEADRAHDVYVRPDATAFREKAVIADTRAISDTVLTYLMAALTGRNPMFQLEGLNRPSRKTSAIVERLLHQQMRRTAGEARIAQHLLDSIRYGYAPTKLLWDNKGRTNQIVNFDPRRCFHDPRVQWGDWDSMGFIGFADFASFDALLRSGRYPKLAKYPGLRNRMSGTNKGWDAHQWHREAGRGLSIDPTDPHSRTGGATNYFTLGESRVVDQVYVCFAGYEVNLPQVERLWMLFSILDESVVIRCQLNPYGQQFPTVIGGLYHDAHKTYSQSLYDLLLPLHDIATWLLRSRVDNVQAALSNMIFADPTQVAVNDIINRHPSGLIRTMPGVRPGDGVFIADIPDVTRGHWNDIEALSGLKQRLSAASDAQQGMPTADGIRSATEIQRLTQLGSQRLGVLSRIISATSIRPMVRMMVANLQDFLADPGSGDAPAGSIRIREDDSASVVADRVKDGYLDFSLADIQGEIDYLVVDGTLPLEPTRNAETWINMLKILNETGMAMEYNSGKIVEEAIRSMGVNDLDQFKISREQQQRGPTPSQQMMLMEKMRGASVQPADDVSRERERGNLVPIDEARRAANIREA